MNEIEQENQFKDTNFPSLYPSKNWQGANVGNTGLNPVSLRS